MAAEGDSGVVGDYKYVMVMIRRMMMKVEVEVMINDVKVTREFTSIIGEDLYERVCSRGGVVEGV